MTLAETLLQELEQEAQTTKRLLERVPNDHLGWRPHPTARTLGELAQHIATVPGAVAELSVTSPVQVPQFTDPPLRHANELLPTLDGSLARARRALGVMSDATLSASWRLMRGERELISIPRIAFLRSVMLNHWYHHRGQLSVYLRALGVPIPLYGPSVDENPFG